MSKIKYVSSSGLTHYDEKIKEVINKVDTSTNTKVTQTPTSSNETYPLLLSPTGQTQETNTTSYFNSGVVLNPSTKTISANIDGNAKTATKATSADSATKDGNGNVIVDTYAEKETIALKSATGTSISIADSKEAPMILNYAPVNLFSHSFETTTIGGITFTANADGTITANGTATGNMEVSIGTHTFTDADIGKTFCWSDNGISVTADINWNAYIYLNNINGVSAWRGRCRFVVEKAHNVVVKIYIAKGTVLENKVYRPMLEEGSTYHTYVPYTGYDIASCGKNLIGCIDKPASGTRCTLSWNGDEVTVKATVSNAWSGCTIGIKGLKQNTKYTISADLEASSTNIYNGLVFGSDAVTRIGYGKSGNVTLTNSTDSNGYIYILFLVDNKLNGVSGDYFVCKNLMLVEGDTALDYEPSVSSSVKVNSQTVFPVSGLESYDGLTNVLNPYSANMQVTYATNEAGQGILKEIETKAEINGSNATGDWDINITGNAATATKATSADSATQDASGNVITDTYAKKSIYGDTVVSMGRKADTTVGDYSCAFGNNNIASSIGTFAAGMDNEVSSTYSAVFGLENIVSNAASLTQGRGNTVTGIYSLVNGLKCTGLQNQLVHGHHNNTTTATENSYNGTSDGTAFVIGNGTSGSKSNAFRVTGKGVIYATNATVQTGADYAEYFEWSDGNPNEEDRVGYFVTFDEDNPEKIKIASKDNYILGIVSGMPNIIGNGDECWKQRYILDDFGRYIEETFEYEVEVPEVVEKEVEDEETGETKIVEEVVIHKETKIGTKWKENPEYDPTQPYIPRDKRAEWSATGMLGVLSVRDDGTCQVNGYCKCTDGGIATACEKGEGYRVIKRISDNIIKVVLK